MKKFRLWIAKILIGDIPFVNQVTVEGTLRLKGNEGSYGGIWDSHIEGRIFIGETELTTSEGKIIPLEGK